MTLVFINAVLCVLYTIYSRSLLQRLPLLLRLSVSSDSLVDRYVVMWEKSNSAASVTVTITDPSATTYTLMGLESEATYSITVTAFNVLPAHPYLLLLGKVYFMRANNM